VRSPARRHADARTHARARVRARAHTHARTHAHTHTHTQARLAAEGVWYQRVERVDEVMREPQAQAALASVPWAAFPLVRCPFQLSASDRHGPAGPPPGVGEHTAAALRSVGVDEAEIAKIVRDGKDARSKL